MPLAGLELLSSSGRKFVDDNLLYVIRHSPKIRPIYGVQQHASEVFRVSGDLLFESSDGLKKAAV